jgi:hypothetical protein
MTLQLALWPSVLFLLKNYRLIRDSFATFLKEEVCDGCLLAAYHLSDCVRGRLDCQILQLLVGDI